MGRLAGPVGSSGPPPAPVHQEEQQGLSYLVCPSLSGSGSGKQAQLDDKSSTPEAVTPGLDLLCPFPLVCQTVRLVLT